MATKKKAKKKKATKKRAGAARKASPKPGSNQTPVGGNSEREEISEEDDAYGDPDVEFTEF